jgi:ribosomal protein S18 acetylase RimI-like enzyme
VIRPPVPSESEVISELILQSDCGMLPALFGPSVKSLLQHLQRRSDNPYSSVNALVITEEAGGSSSAGSGSKAGSGSVAGAMVGSPVSATRRANLRTAGHLFTWYGLALISRFPGLLRAGKALDDLRQDDFYLSHIAVLPGLRGRGTGSLLLRAAEDRAKYFGSRRIVLDVEEHNERARAFYARLDYRELSLVRIDLRRMGVFTLLRLGKGL